jgi:hypothetical protein
VDPTESRRVGITLTAQGQILVNESVARALISDSISGCLLRGTRDASGEIPDVFQLLPTHTLPPLITPPTRFDQRDAWDCAFCGAQGQKVQSLLYSAAQADDLADFNVTEERVVTRGCVRSELVVTQRLYRLLSQCGVTEVAVEPVILL